jgi:ABC-type Fe3+-hydroxamate transport system substrate-binding protein
MGYRLALIGAIFLVFAGSRAAQQRIDTPIGPEISPRWQCRRIVSMAPSITETLADLGLADQVIDLGCCRPSVEAILWQRPDLVIMLDQQAAARPTFEKLKLETLVVSHRSIDGIIESFRTIGRVCGRGPEGRQMASDFRSRIDRLRSRNRGLLRPRVLVVLDRTFGRGCPTDLHVAGDDEYLDSLITLAGAENAYRQHSVRRAVVSAADVRRLDPDAIVELVPHDTIERHGCQAILDDWKPLHNVRAVKTNRILVVERERPLVRGALMRGPSFLRFVEDLSDQLRPEANDQGE